MVYVLVIESSHHLFNKIVLTIYFNEPYHIRSSGIQIFYPGIFDDFGLYICFNTGIDEHTTIHCYKLLI